MDASLGNHDLRYADFFRYAAAACASAIVACWLGLLVVEAIRAGEWIPNAHAFQQAIALAIVFAAYAIGWRRELIGALLAILGTAAFFAVGYLSVQFMPPLPAAWLAVPGVFYLLAWLADGRHYGKSRFPGIHPPTIRIHH